MNTGVVAVRYAKALLAYAKAQGKARQVFEELQCLNRRFLELPRLQQAIVNPVLPADDKVRLLKEAAGGEGVSDELSRFFRLVLDGKRESYLPFMTWSYIGLYQEDQRIQVGKLVTAVPAGRLERRLEEVIARHTHAKVELETVTDPSLIGGFILQLGDYRLDASVAHQLERVKRQFADMNRRIV